MALQSWFYWAWDLSKSFSAEDWFVIPCGPCKEDFPSNAFASRCIFFATRAFFTPIIMVTKSLVAQDMALSCSSAVLLSVFVLSNRRAVKKSTFCSEFIVMKHFCEHLRVLRHELRMFWALVESPACVFGDNQSISYNYSKNRSILKNKSSIIAYQFSREGIACLNTHLSPSNTCVKSLPSGESIARLLDIFFTILINLCFFLRWSMHCEIRCQTIAFDHLCWDGVFFLCE